MNTSISKRHVADRLSRMIGRPVSFGPHSRIENVHAYETYHETHREPERTERVPALLPDGTPALDAEGKPIEGDSKVITIIFVPRVRKKLVEQKTIDLGEHFSFADGEGVEHFIGEDEIAAAIADLEADPPPPPPVHVTYAALRARMSDAEVEAIHKLRRTSWQVDDFVMAAASEKDGIDLRGARTEAAKAMLVKLGVFNEARAAEVFAP